MITERKAKLTFAKQDGPFVHGLEEALSSCNVHRQAYHGGAFVGNHVHTCLQVIQMCTIQCTVASITYP